MADITRIVGSVTAFAGIGATVDGVAKGAGLVVTLAEGGVLLHLAVLAENLGSLRRRGLDDDVCDPGVEMRAATSSMPIPTRPVRAMSIRVGMRSLRSATRQSLSVNE